MKKKQKSEEEQPQQKKSVLRCKIAVKRHSYQKIILVVDGDDLTSAFQNAIVKAKNISDDKWSEYGPEFETELIKRTIKSRNKKDE